MRDREREAVAHECNFTLLLFIFLCDDATRCSSLMARLARLSLDAYVLARLNRLFFLPIFYISSVFVYYTYAHPAIDAIASIIEAETQAVSIIASRPLRNFWVYTNVAQRERETRAQRSNSDLGCSPCNDGSSSVNSLFFLSLPANCNSRLAFQ